MKWKRFGERLKPLSDTNMKIERIELREIQMPLVHFFETSFGRTTTRRIVLVRVHADGLTGWGEVTAGEAPFYSHETTETASALLSIMIHELFYVD